MRTNYYYKGRYYKLYIKDNETGAIFEYGRDFHDSLRISEDGRYLTYYNLQCGEGSLFGTYSFVMEDGKIPAESETVEALHADCYFDIGGGIVGPKEKIRIIQEYRQLLVDKLENEYIYPNKDFLFGIMSLVTDAMYEVEKEIENAR